MEKACRGSKYLLRNTAMPPRGADSYLDEDYRGIRQAILCYDRQMLIVDWEDENVILSTDMFPFVWLRDNCQCSECFHEKTNSRTINFEDLKLDIFPVNIQLTDGAVVELTWNDGHESRYTAHWLHQRIFKKSKNNNEAQKRNKLSKVFWDSSFKKNIPRAKFQELLTDDTALFTWLQQLEVYGIVHVEEVPMSLGQVQLLAQRVGAVKESHYGPQFIVRAKNDSSQISCTSSEVQLHSDCPFMEYKPGITLMHCLVQCQVNGAETRIVDAVRVAQDLRNEQPEIFKILTQVPICWKDRGTEAGREFDKVLYKPVISVNSNGEISRIDYSHHHRDSYFDVNVEVIPIWYKAMKTFSDMLHDHKNLIELKLRPGTIQTFDNLRLLHGRASYKGGGYTRIMETCFLDWDEARSKRRVLEHNLGYTSEHLCS